MAPDRMQLVSGIALTDRREGDLRLIPFAFEEDRRQGGQ